MEATRETQAASITESIYGPEEIEPVEVVADAVETEQPAEAAPAVEQPAEEPAATEQPQPEAEQPTAQPQGQQPTKAKPKSILQDLQGERAKRQEAQAEAERLRAELASLMGKPQQPEGQQPQPEAAEADTLAEMGDDELLTVAQMKQIRQQEQQRATVAKQRQAAVTIQRLAEIHEQQAASELTAEAMGEGLDYASVMQQGAGFLTPDDHKAIQQTLVSGGNAASFAYNLCLSRNPSLMVRFNQAQMQKTLQQLLNPGTNQPQKPGPAPKPQPAPSHRELLRSSNPIASWAYGNDGLEQ